MTRPDTHEDILSLAACPFCGGEGMRIEQAAGTTLTHRCEGRIDRPLITVWDAMCDRAIETWNRRAAPTPPAARSEVAGFLVYGPRGEFLDFQKGSLAEGDFKAGITQQRVYFQPPAAEAPGQEPVFRERSNHDVHRGSESLPCYCWADRDHSIGQESRLTAAPTKQEPVAWQRQTQHEEWLFVHPEDIAHYRGKGQPIRPLYAAPPTYADAEALGSEPSAADIERVADLLADLTGFGGKTTYWYAKARALIPAIRSLASPAPKGET